MKTSLAFLRVFFVIISLIFTTAFMLSLPIGPVWQKVTVGVGVGLLFNVFLFSIETLFKRYHLKAFNTLVLGLFVGYLLGQALALLSNAIMDLTHMKMALQPQTTDLIKMACFLIGIYLGGFLTVRFSDEFHISIPFVKLSTNYTTRKVLLIDGSILSDSRILDLAGTGILDNTLVMPRFLVKELYSQSETGDEIVRSKAKRSIETLKKLEEIPHLGLTYDETLFSDVKDSFTHLLRLARLTDANILTADLSPAQIPIVEGIIVITLHALSNALKPLMQAGEVMKMKIQRFGKEPNQGVGYFEDGTMVVVNGGGDYIGECIDVQVLSVKHTSSGRMIFCNTLDDAPLKGNRVEV